MPTTYHRGRQVLTKRDTARRGRLDIERRIFVTRQACDVRYVTRPAPRAAAGARSPLLRYLNAAL